jgi:hypothetical protein
MRIYEIMSTWYIIPAVAFHKEDKLFISVMFLKWEVEIELW